MRKEEGRPRQILEWGVQEDEKTHAVQRSYIVVGYKKAFHLNNQVGQEWCKSREECQQKREDNSTNVEELYSTFLCLLSFSLLQLSAIMLSSAMYFFLLLPFVPPLLGFFSPCLYFILLCLFRSFVRSFFEHHFSPGLGFFCVLKIMSIWSLLYCLLDLFLPIPLSFFLFRFWKIVCHIPSLLCSARCSTFSGCHLLALCLIILSRWVFTLLKIALSVILFSFL